jgi:hypothetical protein
MQTTETDSRTRVGAAIFGPLTQALVADRLRRLTLFASAERGSAAEMPGEDPSTKGACTDDLAGTVVC